MRILKPFQIKGIPDKGQSTHLRMDNIHITQNGVLKLLSNLNIHKAAGPDEIPTRLLKELAPYLAETFTTFFQASIKAQYHQIGKKPLLYQSSRKEINPVPPTTAQFH